MDHSGALGGAELYLLDVARSHRATSRVILFEPGPFQERLQEENISTKICSAPQALLKVKRSAGWRTAAQAVPGLVRLTMEVAREARNYDVVFANSQKSMLVAGLAGVLARRPVVWNLHDILTADHFSTINRRVAVTWANLLVDRVIVNSRATQSAFVESGGQKEKTAVVHNGIDAEPFEQVTSSDLQQLQEEYDFPRTALLGVFSRLAPWKGQHVVLEALPDLPGVHVLFIGGALFQDDESYEHRLRRTAQRLGVEERAHFLGFRDDVPRLMKFVDVVLHTSVAPEPFGRVVVEGMMACKPVVATHAGGPVEILQDSLTGLLVPPGDSNALASAVQNLIADSQWAASLGKKARLDARRRFSIEKMQRGIAKAVENVR